jgi:hypothetical protein
MNGMAEIMSKKRLIEPLRLPVRQQKGLPKWDPSGLTVEVTRIDVDTFIRSHIPEYRGSFPQYKPNCGPPGWKDSRWIRDKHNCPVLHGGCIHQLRLRCLVALSRLAAGNVSAVTRSDVDFLIATDYEELTQEYLENVAKIDPMAHDLPAVAYAYPLGKRVTKVETSLQRTLAIISRTANGLFLGGHAPYFQDFLKDGPIRYALLAPRPAEG